MFQRKTRRFRRRVNGRNNTPHNNSQSRVRSNSFPNGQIRNNFRHSLSAEKLFEKYTSLAKEAMSLGDKTLSENYLQHADHFMRIIEDKNKSRNQIKVNDVQKSAEEKKNLSVVDNINQTEENKKKD
mgnify:CR=1 FL=1